MSRLWIGVPRVGVLALALFIAALGSDLGAWAAELNGLELSPKGERLQVILDMDAPQLYEVHRHTGKDVTIVLPNAKLPQAFQGTGLPPIQTAEGKMQAEVTESPEGLHVTIHGYTGRPYGVGVMMRRPKVATQLRPPVPSLPRWKRPAPVRLAKSVTPTSKAPRKIAAKSRTKPHLLASSSVKPIQVAHKPSASKNTPKPALKVAAQKPVAVAQKPVTKPTSQPQTATAPMAKPTVPMASLPQKVATAPPTQDGYNFMEHDSPKVVFEAESGEPSPLKEAQKPTPVPPNALKTFKPIPYQSGQYKASAPALTVEHTPQGAGLALQKILPPGLSGPMVKWGLASITMVVGMLLMAGFVAAWLIRRAKANRMAQTLIEQGMHAENFGFGEEEAWVPSEIAPAAKTSEPIAHKTAAEPLPVSTPLKQQSTAAQAVSPFLMAQPKSMSEAIHQSLAFKNPGFATLPTPTPAPPLPKTKSKSRFADMLDQT